MSVQRETEIPEEDIQYPGIQIQQTIDSIQQSKDVTDAFINHCVPVKNSSCCQFFKDKLNMSMYAIDKTIQLPPMVREFQMSCLSTTDYIKEYNLVYITAGHRLLVWEYQSLNQWSIYDEIIGNIQKVCFIQSKSPLSPECTFDLVVATSTEITLVGVCLKDKNISFFNYGIHYAIPENSIKDILSTPNGHIFISSKDVLLYECIFGKHNSLFQYFGWSYYCSLIPIPYLLPQSSHSSIHCFCYDKQHDYLFILLEDETICWCSYNEQTHTYIMRDCLKDITLPLKQSLQPSIAIDSEYTLCDLTLLSPSLSSHVILLAITPNGYRFYFTIQEDRLIQCYSCSSNNLQSISHVFSLGKDILLMNNDSIYVITPTVNETSVYEEELTQVLSLPQVILSFHTLQSKPVPQVPLSFTASGCDLHYCGIDNWIDFEEDHYLLCLQNSLIEIRKRREKEIINELLHKDACLVKQYSTLSTPLIFTTRILNCYCSENSDEIAKTNCFTILTQTDLPLLLQSIYNCLAYCYIPLHNETVTSDISFTPYLSYLNTLLQFIQQAYSCSLPVLDITAYSYHIKTLYSIYFHIQRMISILSLKQFYYQFPPINWKPILLQEPLLSFVSSKQSIHTFMTLLSESIHSSIYSPLFNDIVDTASKLFHNYFPYCERLFLEAESLLLQPRQPAIIHMVQEKLKSVYLTAVDEEIMTYTHRIFNLSQLSLSEKLSVVFTGLSNILTANCSYGGIFNTEQADQQRLKIISQIEDFIITTIQPFLSEQPELFDIINQCDLLSFQEKCIQTLIQPTNDYKLLFNMNEQYLEHFISHSNPVYLHEYYIHHGLFKKAAEFAYSLCYPTDDEPELSLAEKKIFMEYCLNDYTQWIQAGGDANEIAQFSYDYLVRKNRSIPYQLLLQDGCNKIYEYEELIDKCSKMNRFDLIIQYFVSENAEREEINHAWICYLTEELTETSFNELKELLLQVKDSYIPISLILTACYNSLPNSLVNELYVFCYHHNLNCNELCLVMKELFERERREEKKILFARVVLECCKDHITDEIRSVAAFIQSDLLTLVMKREEGQQIMHELQNYLYYCFLEQTIS